MRFVITSASTPSPARPPHAAANRSAGDMLHGMGARLLYAATRVALPPLALAHMGLADYGLWAACFVLVAYLGMAASGFTLVTLRGTAAHHAAGDMAALGRLLVTGMLALAALGGVLLAGLWWLMPVLLAGFGVPAAQQALASQLWLGAAAVFLADLSLGAFAHVLHAIGRVRQEQRVWVAAFVLESVLIVVLLRAGWGAHGLLAAFGLRHLFSAGANAWLARRALPGLVLSWRGFDPALLRSFFGFGAAMQLSGLLATALHSADRLLAGALLGPAATALVDLAAKLPTTAAAIGSSASGVAVAASARHDARGQALAVQQVYQDATRITVASLAVTLPFLAAFAPLLALAWLGAGPTASAVAALLPALALGLHAHLLTGPATAVSRGRGRLAPDLHYAGLRLTTLLLAVAWVVHRPAPDLPTLVHAVVAAQLLAAAGFLVPAHRQLGGRGRTLLLAVLLPSLGAHALAQGLQALGQPWWAAAHDRSTALWALAGAGMLWLALGVAWLGACLWRPAAGQPGGPARHRGWPGLAGRRA